MSDFPEQDVWLAHRVSYGETDAMSVLYYAEYLHLFERSRNEYIRSNGITYKEVEAKGFFAPVRRAECRYRRPVRYDDQIWVRAAINRWGRASFNFVYEIYNLDKSFVHADGSTEHALVNREGRPVPVPDWFRAAFK
ncbi:MAG: acyl-CoA thioesterase [Deltaproteobacteria bacterium]|jgi:acyl-CoA thioester hydrolase|nr:acyl-CoA thioesterase [Deltaproteobacteria bacterium]